MPSGFVDLRSDTVTRPTAEMRRAMAEADVGDDVYGEDPTVNALQEEFADRVGMEQALFVPSGTMANQIAIRLLAPPGTTVLAGARQHLVVYENGAAGINGGVQIYPLADDDGTVSSSDVAWVVAAADHHYPTPSLLCLENTHMPAGGTPWPLGPLRDLLMVAAGFDLAVHIDGARLFNASVATGISPAEYCRGATTVMACLSKGLAAPVGSVLAGPAEVMAQARVARQRLGGGMRQAGVLAAAGLVALRTMVDRLAEDHERAQRLATAVDERWPKSGCRPFDVLTNVVVWEHPQARAVVEHLRAEGVLAGTIAPNTVRLVTHCDVDDAGIERALTAIAGAP